MHRITPLVKYLIIINVIIFVATEFLKVGLISHLALYYPGSELFRPYQLVSYMFMHGGVFHIFFNMYALWLFGSAIEYDWGGKRFLFYFFFTGIGAAILHLFVNYLEYSKIAASITAFQNSPTPELFIQFINKHKSGFRAEFISNCYELYDNWSQTPDNDFFAMNATAYMRGILNAKMNIPTVGASGAVYGILLAFGMMYPNAQLMLLIPPMPVKAKWLVIVYGGIALFMGLSRPGSNIAHFAHLGGMLFGFILIKFWIAQANRR